MPNIQWSPSPNYSSREGRKIIAIVDHITDGGYPGCLEWLQNPISQASAHYLVTKTGLIFQLVKDENKAWDAGEVVGCTWSLYDGTNPNLYTVGIEHEGLSGDSLTEAQYQSTLWLHKQLISKWGIPIDNNHIIPHSLINKNHGGCPGNGFPWTRLFNDLKGGNKVNKAILIFSADDLPCAKRLQSKIGNCAIFFRNSDGSAPNDVKNANQLFVVGGSGTVGHPNEILLQGSNWFGTADKVSAYIGY